MFLPFSFVNFLICFLSSSTFFLSSGVEDRETVIWKMVKNNTDSFSSVGWVNKCISNDSDLILIDCEETDEFIGQNPLRYQVYALVNNELVLIE